MSSCTSPSSGKPDPDPPALLGNVASVSPRHHPRRQILPFPLHSVTAATSLYRCWDGQLLSPDDTYLLSLSSHAATPVPLRASRSPAATLADTPSALFVSSVPCAWPEDHG